MPKRKVPLIALLAMALFVATALVLLAADSVNHTVNVTIAAVNEIAVSGTVTLSVSGATAGSDLGSDTDSASTLSWTTNGTSKKITVATQAAPNCTLQVEATGVSKTGSGACTPASAVTLSTTAADFITAVGQTYGDCNLSYELAATVTDSILASSDVIVIYTIADV